jgi:two-component system, cell cycle response regulator
MVRTILVVEDEAIVAHDIRQTLVAVGYEVSATVATGEEALRAAEIRQPDLVLMDVRLQGPLDGIETAARLRAKHDVPVIFLTAHSDEATLARVMTTLPYGYIIKPFSDRELRTAIELALSRRNSESQMLARTERLTELNAELTTRAEERQRSSDRHLAIARMDVLTEAGNRLHFETELEGIADRVRRYGHRYCVAFCDIDSFKSYNDAFGHLAGDDAIRAVARAMRDQLRAGDGFFRYGGDEFLAILPEQTLAGARECMERVTAAVRAIPTAANGGVLVRGVTLSVGIAEFRGASNPEATQAWLKRADAALYRAKARGRNCVEVDS